MLVQLRTTRRHHWVQPCFLVVHQKCRGLACEWSMIRKRLYGKMLLCDEVSGIYISSSNKLGSINSIINNFSIQSSFISRSNP